MNPRDALPYLCGASYLRVPPKVKAQAEAGEMDRTRPSRIILSLRTKVQQTASGGRTKLHVLHVKRALKGVQLQPSAPELQEWQHRLGEKQSLNLAHRRQALQTLQALVTLVSPYEQVTERGSGFSGVLGQQEGRREQRGRSR